MTHGKKEMAMFSGKRMTSTWIAVLVVAQLAAPVMAYEPFLRDPIRNSTPPPTEERGECISEEDDYFKLDAEIGDDGYLSLRVPASVHAEAIRTYGPVYSRYTGYRSDHLSDKAETHAGLACEYAAGLGTSWEFSHRCFEADLVARAERDFTYDFMGRPTGSRVESRCSLTGKILGLNWIDETQTSDRRSLLEKSWPLYEHVLFDFDANVEILGVSVRVGGDSRLIIDGSVTATAEPAYLYANDDYSVPTRYPTRASLSGVLGSRVDVSLYASASVGSEFLVKLEGGVRANATLLDTALEADLTATVPYYDSEEASVSGSLDLVIKPLSVIIEAYLRETYFFFFAAEQVATLLDYALAPERIPLLGDQ
ncbi:MAG: hypothetical protein ACYTGN_12630 [Planctomycetota bacterium]|jgi:hypothetical protein